jgi:hypothetical protein
MPEAQRLDQETATLNSESEEMLNHHHRFAVSVTLFQVAIGLAAIAALLRHAGPAVRLAPQQFELVSVHGQPRAPGSNS